MKQFVICLFFSILLYLGGAMLAGNWNPMLWTDLAGKFFFIVFLFLIWLVPIALNYLNGGKNFE